jgi:hypothetical protein
MYCAKLTFQVDGLGRRNRCEHQATTYSYVPFESLQRFESIGSLALLVSPIQPTFVSAYHRCAFIV